MKREKSQKNCQKMKICFWLGFFGGKTRSPQSLFAVNQMTSFPGLIRACAAIMTGAV
jgi:hypothetical protein